MIWNLELKPSLTVPFWKKELLQLMQKFSLILFVNFLIMMLRLKQTEI